MLWLFIIWQSQSELIGLFVFNAAYISSFSRKNEFLNKIQSCRNNNISTHYCARRFSMKMASIKERRKILHSICSPWRWHILIIHIAPIRFVIGFMLVWNLKVVRLLHLQNTKCQWNHIGWWLSSDSLPFIYMLFTIYHPSCWVIICFASFSSFSYVREVEIPINHEFSYEHSKWLNRFYRFQVIIFYCYVAK